ncbi:MAG: HD domain-containing protein [Candidatus Omnitrophica bacterium]|nr:HD domain-containing protein [Candidatus Omnitrophota bacterium]
MSKKEDMKLLDFISEAGLLKRVKRSGWWVLGIKDPETVSEHCFRCAVIGYIIAKMEKVEPYKVLLMTLFNDIHEARLCDLHKMSQKYITQYDKAEDAAFSGQIEHLPSFIKEELKDMQKEYRDQKTKQAIISRDADIIECLIQAKEYEEFGYKESYKFMKKAPSFLKTKTAKKLWKLAKTNALNGWWERESVFKR